MKLSTALAVLIAIQRHGHRMSASASPDDHERKLLINQDDAAKRVNDAVKLTMASVAAGDVHGVALPLNYVHRSDFEGTQLLTVALRLPGVDMDQHVVVDTGSSSLTFCNTSLAEEATNITKMDYAQCNAYGDLYTCPDDPSVTGAEEFYVGQVFQGNIAAYNTGTGEEVASMDDVNFAIMSEQRMGFCNGGLLDGIFGVAYSANNDVIEIPSPEFDVLNLWNQSCESDGVSVGNCIAGNMSALPSPLQQSLQVGVDSGYNSVEAFGLYCDYAATIGSKKDTIVPSLGAYFGGDAALNNSFYNSGIPQVPGLNFSQSGFNQCNECNCFTDSGTSSINLPLPPSFCKDLTGNVSDLKEMGSMLLDLDGVNGSTVTLSLPMLWVAEQIALGYVFCTGTSTNFVLGLPIYQYYYLVYNMGNNTITFVDLQLSNETEAFVDGPKLGGANEPSSGYHLSSSSLVTMGFLLLACKYMF